MNGRKVNLAFLISIILYIACVFGIAFLFPKLLESIVTSNMICELLLALPGLLFLSFSENKIIEFLHFKKIKIGTLLVIIPFTFFSMPLIILANLLSQFLVENEVTAAMESSQVGEMPLLLLLYSVGIFAPFCEELVCRGVYYRGYRKSGSAFKAMILSSLLFALMHMNLNQAVYAFVMGVMAVLLVEATGSLWSSFLYHALINSSQVYMMHAMLKVNPSAYSEAAEAMTTETMVFALGAYLIIVAVTLPIAWALLVWMSGHEGRRGVLPLIWIERKKKEDKLLTIPLIFAFILCIAMMLWPYLIQILYRYLAVML